VHDVMEFCARIDFISQSKDEEEYLFLPLTLLEIKEGPTQEKFPSVIKVHAKSFIHILTTEEIAKQG
jgi:hypothetical protein